MQLNYKESGEGFPLIILHGLLGSLDNWQTLARKFSEDFKVFIVDQRNHGRSPHTDEHSYPLMAQDLKAFFEEHDIDQAYLIGHSMGGKTAMQFAVEYPKLVKKLVVVDIAPKWYDNRHEVVFKALFNMDLSQIESRSDADHQMSEYIAEKPVRQFLLKNLKRTGQESFEWKMNLQALADNYDKLSAPIEADQPENIETLVIKGGQSDYVQDDDLELFQSLFTDVVLKEIPKAGHWVHAEAPKDFYKVVKGFLDADS